MNHHRAIGVDLLRVAGRARRVLDREATARIASFLASRTTPEGGFCGRGAAADLYYTLFGTLAGQVVGAPPDRRRLTGFLAPQRPAGLDLPHLAALIQCQRLAHRFGLPRRWRDEAALALSAFRAADGGFGTQASAAPGTAYGLYLAVLVCEAMGTGVPAPGLALAAGTELLRTGLASPGSGLSPLVSAALAVQALGGELPAASVCTVVDGCRVPAGGFRAHARAAAADLLSTAVGAYALCRLGSPLGGAAAAATARFVEGLWDASGGFRGSADDPMPDCEYTFYALLALGALEP